LVHEIRGLLSEYGMILPQRLTKFRALIVDKLHEEQAKLTTLSAEVFWHLDDAFRAMEKRLAYDDEKLAAIGQAHPAYQRLQIIPGIGPVTATALITAIGDVTPFKNGCQLAAWLGLVPREHSTGGKPRLLGMSTRGNLYLRKLFVHGARDTLRWIDTKDDERSRWLKALIARRRKNRAAVALANKNARIVWALLTVLLQKSTSAIFDGCNPLKYRDTIFAKSVKNWFLQQNRRRCRHHSGSLKLHWKEAGPFH